MNVITFIFSLWVTFCRIKFPDVELFHENFKLAATSAMGTEPAATNGGKKEAEGNGAGEAVEAIQQAVMASQNYQQLSAIQWSLYSGSRG